MKMLAPDLGFGFSWDPDDRNLWIVHGNGRPHEQIAGGVMNPQEAEALVGMWCKGYRSRAREDHRTLGSKHYHVLAEQGAVGARLG
jgi:hypothetical protein